MQVSGKKLQVDEDVEASCGQKIDVKSGEGERWQQTAQGKNVAAAVLMAEPDLRVRDKQQGE